jgi:hypothetical protein
VFAEVESSCNGKFEGGHYMLTIADCRRSIRLDFFLGNALARRRSLAKIDQLLKILKEFRAALFREAQLIDSHSRKQSTAARTRKIKPN